jgi:hypothetical protein
MTAAMLKRPKSPRTVSYEMTAAPWRGSSMSGRYGSESWDLPEVYGSGGPMGGPSIYGMLGRFLHEGSRVRVTVEVLDEAKVGPINLFSIPPRKRRKMLAKNRRRG